MQPHRRGDLTEAIVVAELKRRGIAVARPVGDNERYDLVAESDAGLWTLQIKTGRLRDGTIRFHGKSQHTNAQGNTYQPYDGDVDYFTVYCGTLEQLYLIEESAVGSNMRLRVDEPDKRDRTINWAREYEFDSRWPPEDTDPPRTGDNQAIRRRLDAAGIRTWYPTDDPPHHDALVERDDGSVARVRFERGWLVDGRMRFDTGDRDRPPKAADPADCVFVYCDELERMYVIEREAYDTTISLRVEPPEKPHGQSNPASEYEFPAAWPE